MTEPTGRTRMHGASSEEVLANWEQIKKAEKGRESIMDGIPKALPALAYFPPEKAISSSRLMSRMRTREPF